jgi:hypothetical protein
VETTVAVMEVINLGQQLLEQQTLVRAAAESMVRHQAMVVQDL